MERKNIIFYSAVGVICLGVLVGVVVFLRLRNAPAGDLKALTAPATTGTQTKAPASTALPKEVPPFTPLSSEPKVPAWKPGDPVPPAQTWPEPYKK